jgi:hypothetical protein
MPGWMRALTAVASSSPVSVVDLELDQQSDYQHEPRHHGHEEFPPVSDQRVGPVGFELETEHDTSQKTPGRVCGTDDSPNRAKLSSLAPVSKPYSPEY